MECAVGMMLDSQFELSKMVEATAPAADRRFIAAKCDDGLPRKIHPHYKKTSAMLRIMAEAYHSKPYISISDHSIEAICYTFAGDSARRGMAACAYSAYEPPPGEPKVSSRQALFVFTVCHTLDVHYELFCFACGIRAPEEQVLNYCGHCRLAVYCSKQCQRDHRKIHEPSCKCVVAELKEMIATAEAVD